MDSPPESVTRKTSSVCPRGGCRFRWPPRPRSRVVDSPQKRPQSGTRPQKRSRLSPMRPLFFVAFASSIVQAQPFNWDVFTYSVPVGWQRYVQGGSVELREIDGPRFCQIGLIKAAPGSGDAQQDFDKDWATLVAKPYRAPSRQPSPGQDIGNWRALVATAKVMLPPTGNFDVTMNTYSAPSQVATVLLLGNHVGCSPHFREFLANLRLANGPGNVSLPPAANQPPRTMGTLDGQADIRSANIEDWRVEIQAEGVRFTRGNIIAFQFYNVSLDDRLRSGDTGLNFWNLIVPRSYRVLSQTPLEEESFSYSKNYAVTGQVADNAGRRYAAFLSTEIANGIGTPFLSLAPDEGSLRNVFPNAESLRSMRRFNYFPVSRAELAGRWTSSFSSAAETYYVSTGNFAGLAVASANVDFNFSANGTYTQDVQAVTGRIGNLNVGRERRQGTFEVEGNTLILRRSNGEVEVFNCGLRALRGGKALSIVNRKYTTDRWDLLRAK